ncbi:MAG TPA: tetratricopeptide repeat protein [Methylomirabilota bacterium]|nr:tetratricopeptide repeat protein [Methylomirabilota bacterium]
MSRLRSVLAVVAIVAVAIGAYALHRSRQSQIAAVSANEYVGSATCGSCHKKFYDLWSTSFHGLAMQRYTPALARAQGFPTGVSVRIGGVTYKTDLSDQGGAIVEQSPSGEHRYPIEFTLGGKNVYYFLAPLDRGFLQVLPLAYDVREKTWMDSTRSMTMHENISRSEPVAWRDRALTFNTSCYGCHVSQIETNYVPSNDSYHTTWLEPGINCETCHGPAGKHVRLYQQAEKSGKPPAELGLISYKDLSHAQRNDSCGACHAKASLFTDGFRTGDKFYDHFSLSAYENNDYYPDGRDIGENYTYTSWSLSPCVKSGQLDCIHCHTSSGRYRYATGDPNGACLPCHEDRVKNATAHTHHKADSLGNRCISCHMPMTDYAHMRRSDHSMRPPAPAASIAFGSPNACNICHKDKDAKWADKLVREWHKDDYQAPILAQAALIDAARKHDWSKLPQMLAYIKDPNHDPIFTASLIRLLFACPDPRKFDALESALKDPSPLVRSSAIDGISQRLDSHAINLLAQASKDETRLVRIRAASALSVVPPTSIDETLRPSVQAATKEYVAALNTRQDDFAQHLNLGNFHANRKELNEAAAEYERAAVLRPGIAASLVNASVVYSQLGDLNKAEDALRRAIAADPTEPAAYFNLGLLLAEKGQADEAVKQLRKALQLDKSNAAAAYNLAVLVAPKNPAEALALAKQAAASEPQNPKYSSAVAYYQQQLSRHSVSNGVANN